MLTAEEWALLREGLEILPAERLREIGQATAALADQASRPIVCPMLDQAEGACLVYAHRPVACLTYGFYVQRDLGLYCNDIESRVVGGGEWAEVVWDNHNAIDNRLRTLGDARELTEWFVRWTGGGD